MIGLGSIGRRRAKVLSGLGCEVIGHDTAAWARSLNDMVDVPVSSLLELWKQKPDAVFICTPPNSHMELALAAVDRGIPTFIEKPLADRLSDDLGYLVHLAEQRKTITMVGCNLRYHGGPATVKRWLEDKAIGDVLYGRFYTGSYLPDWVPSRDYKTSYVAKTGVILDAGSHEVDLALHLLGPAKLQAAAWWPASSIGLDCDGLAELTLIHESGAISSVNLSFVEYGYRRGCEIVGSRGSIEWRDEDRIYTLYGENGTVEDGDYYDQEEERDWMYRSELEHFLGCVEHKRETCNPIGKAIDVLDILLKARKEGNKWAVPSA